MTAQTVHRKTTRVASPTKATRRHGISVIGWVACTTVWAGGFLGLAVLVAGFCWAIHPPQTPNEASSGEIASLVETGAALELEVGRIIQPAIQRTERLAKDPQVVEMLTKHDALNETVWLNRAVASSTEVDALALFDSTGHITAINTQYANGEPIAPARLSRILGADFGKREIIQKCLRNGINSPVLEFQTHCDITPALFDSTGLSVAYSVPIHHPESGAKIGVISARLKFDRLTSLVQGRVIGGGFAKVYFVTDAGAYFSETINAQAERPPIPVAELHDIVQTSKGAGIQGLIRHGDKYVLVIPLKGFVTLEGGGIRALLISDERWIMEDTRREKLLQAAAAAVVGSLLVIVAGLLQLYLATRQMKLTIESASAANARLAAIVHASADAIIGETLDGVVQSWNSAAEKLFGYAMAEVEGRRSEILEPADRPHEMADQRADVLRGNPIDNVETQRVRKGGQLLDVAVSLAVIRNREGVPAGIARIARDISRQKQSEHELRKAFDEMERRVAERTAELSQTVAALKSQMAERLQVEARLRESEQRFRQFAENTKDVFWMTSGAGDRVIYVNPTFEKVWGRSCQEIYNDAHAWIDAIEPEDRPTVMKSWTSLQVSGEYEAEYRIRRPDGTIRWIRDRALPIRDEKGEIYRIAGIAEDFTERRTGEQQVLEAKEAAETANRAKSEFLAKMSHEIRTPLNGVIGVTNLLLDSPLDARQQRFAKLIKASGQTLAELINDILDFSKIEARALDLESIEFDLPAVLEEVTEVMAHRALEKGVELACFVGPEVPRTVRGDPARVKQILVNLVNNAIKFTANGCVSTRLTLDSQSEQHLVARFAVTDTGIGIAPEGLRRLFKSFSQVETSTTRTHGGTGLGLAIAKQLAELMGGAIGVESIQGQGSTFWFTVKLEPAAPASRSKRALSVDLQGARVLAVDDNAIMREILRDQIGSWGMEIETTADGEKALQMLTAATTEGKPYRLAILDSNTSSFRAVELGRMIKSRPEIAGTALLIVLPMDCNVEAQALKAAGFCGHLLKPVRQSHLHDAIMNAVGAAPTSSSAVETRSQTTAVDSTVVVAGRARVLLAEDNSVNQIVASEILARHGYTYDVVDNGRKAADAASRENYDLILMDCSMPVMDGFEATREIRRHEANDANRPNRRVPIVALTANAIKGDRELCIAAGMDAYVSKPVDAVRLVETIEFVLAGGGANQTTAGASVPVKTVDRPARAVPAAPFVIDELMNRCMGSIATALTILDEFEKQIENELPQLKASLDRGDGARAAKFAHALKGASGVLSAAAVHHSAAELEHLCRAGTLGNADALFSKLREEIAACIEFIPAARTTIGSQKAAIQEQGQ